MLKTHSLRSFSVFRN